jgi:hypothetical protein
MTLALDHVFVCTAAGAPEAALLLAAGFAEGTPNVHPGQGTACRRFFFRNAYLELLWVDDAVAARDPRTAPTRLWDRWRDRADGRTCPFGLAVRGAADDGSPPFPTWPYRPGYLPPGVAIPVGTNSDALHEPMTFVLPFGRRPDAAADGDRQPLVHATGVREVTRLALHGPPAEPSAALAAVTSLGIVERVPAERPALVLGFDGEAADRELDLRPALPLLLRW